MASYEKNQIINSELDAVSQNICSEGEVLTEAHDILAGRVVHDQRVHEFLERLTQNPETISSSDYSQYLTLVEVLGAPSDGTVDPLIAQTVESFATVESCLG